MNNIRRRSNSMSEHTIGEVVMAKCYLKREIEDLLNKFYEEYQTPLNGDFSIDENLTFQEGDNIPCCKQSVSNCNIKLK